MLADVGQRLLEDAEHHGGGLGIGFDVFSIGHSEGHLARQPGLPGEFLGLPFEGGRDTDVEDARAQVGRDALGLVDGTVDQRLDIAGPFDELGIGVGQPPHQHRERHLDRRQVATDAVVDVACHALALLFLDAFDVGRELLHARAGQRDLDLGELALGDVGHDAGPLDRAAVEHPRGAAQVDPLHVLPALHREPALPVPGFQAVRRRAHRLAERRPVVGQDQVFEPRRRARQRIGCQTEQRMAVLAEIGEGDLPVGTAHQLEHQAGGARHDRAQARFAVGQSGGPFVPVAQVVADDHELVTVHAPIQQHAGLDRVAGAAAPDVGGLGVHRRGRLGGQRAAGTTQQAGIEVGHHLRHGDRAQLFEGALQAGQGGHVGIEEPERDGIGAVDLVERATHHQVELMAGRIRQDNATGAGSGNLTGHCSSIADRGLSGYRTGSAPSPAIAPGRLQPANNAADNAGEGNASSRGSIPRNPDRIAPTGCHAFDAIPDQQDPSAWRWAPAAARRSDALRAAWRTVASRT